MKRILIACFMLAGVSLAEDYVLATKLSQGWFVPSASMPYSAWTNSTLWLTAESPVLNAGTTTAEWLCYAKTCAGDGTQTTLASQPASIVTNGVTALSFDGGDVITQQNPPVYSNNFSVYVSFLCATQPVNGAGLISTFNGGGWLLQYGTAGTTDINFGGRSPTGSFAAVSAASIGTGNRKAVATFADGTAKLYIDGSLTATATNLNSTLYGSAPRLRVGLQQSSHLTGLIYDVKLFDRVLTSNEVWSISQ